jgi:uncharacterized membrane protein YidH (DUF202 family)
MSDHPSDNPRATPDICHADMGFDTNTTITPSDCTSPHNVPCRNNHDFHIAKYVFSASIHWSVSSTTERMTAPQLELPSAALHAPAHGEPHVDSEEAVQYERRRVSRELEPMYSQDASRQNSEAPHASLRSRNASMYSASTSHERLRNRNSDVSDADTVPDAHDSEGAARSTRSSIHVPHWYDPITKFWRSHVSITIDDGAHRDHLGANTAIYSQDSTDLIAIIALERTFLGYLRTSLILVMTGVLTAQLFRLQHAANPNAHLGFYVIGRPLSIMFIGMGILVVVIGAMRFWKLQRGLVRGKAHTGGWEILLIMVLTTLVR